MRAGEVLEPALLSVCKEATIGKILIQTNETTDEPAVRKPVSFSFLSLSLIHTSHLPMHTVHLSLFPAPFPEAPV